MGTSLLNKDHFDQAMQMFKSGSAYNDIEHYLQGQSLSPSEITQVMNFIYEERYAKRRKRGYALIFTGGAFLLLGFALTMGSSLAGGSDTTMLYIMTTLGISVAFVGLVVLCG